MYTAIPIMYENSSSKHISNNKIYNNIKSPYNRTSCDEDKVFPNKSHSDEVISCYKMWKDNICNKIKNDNVVIIFLKNQ